MDCHWEVRGTISGTPTAPGNFTFTVTARDSQGSTGQKAFTINVVNPVVITTPSLPDGRRGDSYLFGFGATGGTPPYTWLVVSGSLPPGLSLNTNTGVLIGTASAPGAFSFVVQVKDVLGQSATKSFTINVTDPTPTTPRSPRIH